MFLLDRPLTILILLAIYVIMLHILKISGYKNRIFNKSCNNCCPKCDKSLERIRRNYYDHFINYFTFYIFNFKRFTCKDCNWTGLRSENQILKKSV